LSTKLSTGFVGKVEKIIKNNGVSNGVARENSD